MISVYLTGSAIVFIGWAIPSAGCPYTWSKPAEALWLAIIWPVIILALVAGAFWSLRSSQVESKTEAKGGSL